MNEVIDPYFVILGVGQLNWSYLYFDFYDVNNKWIEYRLAIFTLYKGC
jgi:hypothetical protein